MELTKATAPQVPITKEENPLANKTATAPLASPVSGAVYPIEVSKKIIIYPKIRTSVLPEEGILVNSALSYVQKIGSAYSGTIQLGRTILTREEEHKYMPLVIGISPAHQEWDKMLDTYWINLSVDVPASGLSLEVGEIQTSETEFTPINVHNWLLYKYCLKYSHVANNIKDVNASPKIRFYIMDATEVNKVALDLKQTRDKALLRRMELESKLDYVRAILELSGNRYSSDYGENELRFSELANNSPVKFLELASDTRLLDKYFVERAIQAGILNRPLNSTVVMFDGAVIGKDLLEASNWLKSPANNEVYVSIRARLDKFESMLTSR